MENHLNICNQFVPYELAVKLKELGFDEKCLAVYTEGKLYTLNWVNHELITKAPLWQQAFEFILNKVDLEIASEYMYVLCFDGQFYINKHTYVSFGNDSISLLCRGNEKSLEKLIELIQNKNDRSI